MYVLVAFVGGMLIIFGAKNVAIDREYMGVAIAIANVVPFLGITRQFTNNVSQVSQQTNAIVMAMAGAKRIFELLDQTPEVDEGYVKLVNAKIEDGEIVECGVAGVQLHAVLGNIGVAQAGAYIQEEGERVDRRIGCGVEHVDLVAVAHTDTCAAHALACASLHTA